MADKNNTPKVVHRPQQAEYAIKLLLTSLVFSVLVAYITNSVSTSSQYFEIYAYLILLGVLVNGYFVYKITQNRNWARKIYIVFTIISTVFYTPQIITTFASTPFNAILQIAAILIQLAAVYFLLRKETKEWFLLVNSPRT